jgi:acyl-CoA thioester hydrolase
LVRVSRLGKSSFDFLVGIFRANEALAEILITYVNANPQTRKSVPLKDAFKNKICEFEVMPPEGSAQSV